MNDDRSTRVTWGGRCKSLLGTVSFMVRWCRWLLAVSLTETNSWSRWTLFLLMQWFGMTYQHLWLWRQFREARRCCQWCNHRCKHLQRLFQGVIILLVVIWVLDIIVSRLASNSHKITAALTVILLLRTVLDFEWVSETLIKRSHNLKQLFWTQIFNPIVWGSVQSLKNQKIWLPACYIYWRKR